MLQTHHTRGNSPTRAIKYNSESPSIVTERVNLDKSPTRLPPLTFSQKVEEGKCFRSNFPECKASAGFSKLKNMLGNPQTDRAQFRKKPLNQPQHKFPHVRASNSMDTTPLSRKLSFPEYTSVTAANRVSMGQISTERLAVGERPSEVDALIERIKKRLKEKDELKKLLLIQPRRNGSVSPMTKKIAIMRNETRMRSISYSKINHVVEESASLSPETKSDKSKRSQTISFKRVNSLQPLFVNQNSQTSILKKPATQTELQTEETRKEYLHSGKTVKFGN